MLNWHFSSNLWLSHEFHGVGMLIYHCDHHTDPSTATRNNQESFGSHWASAIRCRGFQAAETDPLSLTLDNPPPRREPIDPRNTNHGLKHHTTHHTHATGNHKHHKTRKPTHVKKLGVRRRNHTRKCHRIRYIFFSFSRIFITLRKSKNRSF